MIFIYNSNKIKIIIYIFIQAFRSSSLLFFIFLKTIPRNYSIISNTGIILRLALKLGFFPFHSWYPNINKNLKWIIIYFIFTIQKIRPIILSTNISYINSFTFIILINSIIASINIYYSNNYKIILSYSSLIHSRWLIILLILSNKNFLNYLIFYLLITTLLIYLIIKFNLYHTNQCSIIKNYNNWILYLIILSYARLPPFSGFYIKWIGLIELEAISFNTNCFIVISSLNAIFIYIKIFLSITLSLKYKKWIKYKFNIIHLKIFFYLSLFPFTGIIIFINNYE